MKRERERDKLLLLRSDLYLNVLSELSFRARSCRASFFSWIRQHRARNDGSTAYQKHAHRHAEPEFPATTSIILKLDCMENSSRHTAPQMPPSSTFVIESSTRGVQQRNLDALFQEKNSNVQTQLILEQVYSISMPRSSQPYFQLVSDMSRPWWLSLQLDDTARLL